MIYANDIQVPNKEKIDSQYVSIYEENENLSKFIYKFWDNRKMIKTFPNIKVQDVDGNILYMDSYLDIQPYYMKIFSKKENNNIYKLLQAKEYKVEINDELKEVYIYKTLT